MYMTLTSLEAGAAFFLLFPHILGPKTDIKTLMSPAWEVTNVFLVFTVVGLLSFFPPALVFLTTHLFVVFSIAAIVIAIRALAVMLLFYGQSERQLWRWLFFVCSCLIPLLLLSVITLSLLGPTQASFGVYLSLAGVSLAVIFWLSSSFFAFFEKTATPELGQLNTVSGWAFLGFSGLTIFILHGFASYLFANSVVGMSMGILLVLAWLVSALARTLARAKWAFMTAVLTVLLLVMGLSILHLPYIIYPDITLASSFVGQSTFSVLIIGFVIGMIFVLPGLYLLYGLILGWFE